MSLLPVRPGRLEDPAFLEEFREHIASELLDFVTSPTGGGYSSASASEIFDHFQSEARFPLGDTQVHDLFVRLCQDIRLTPDEIDELQSKWFS